MAEDDYRVDFDLKQVAAYPGKGAHGFRVQDHGDVHGQYQRPPGEGKGLGVETLKYQGGIGPPEAKGIG